MGYMRHHAIVVTASYDARISRHSDDPRHWIEVAHEAAVESGLGVSEIVDSPTNGYRSFFCATDGSKEGWLPSEVGDESRERFIIALRSFAYGDGSSPIDWVEVQYGDDDRVTKVVAHSEDSIVDAREAQ